MKSRLASALKNLLLRKDVINGSDSIRFRRFVLIRLGTFAGLVIGNLAAQVLTRLISSLLFGVSSTDAVTYLTVSFMLAAVALLASDLPARRTTQIDPLVALRQE